MAEDANLMLISADLDRSLLMLSDDPNDITGMANFFFDWRIGRENVTIGYSRRAMLTLLAGKNYDFALISGEDWKALSSKPEIEKKFNATSDASGQVVLLKPQ